MYVGVDALTSSNAVPLFLPGLFIFSDYFFLALFLDERFLRFEGMLFISSRALYPSDAHIGLSNGTIRDA